MRVRNVDRKTWDWQFGQSQYNYTKDETAILLNVQMKLKEWYQDCFFALQNGIPWNIRLGSKNQKQALDKDILNTVRSVDGVLQVFNFESAVIGRRYRCTMDIFTEFSTTAKSLTFDTEEIQF